MNGHSGNGAGRKPGQWQDEMRMRLRKERTHRTTRGVTNMPSVMEVGSAAYRRLLASKENPRR